MERISNKEREHSVPLPTFAWVAYTNKCNLGCKHCQRELLRLQGLMKLREMSDYVFHKLEREVLPHLERIQLGGNNFGEQLLSSNWDSFFTEISKFETSISVVCNATLLNPDRIKMMVDSGVEFNFSLEGASKDSYEKVRGFGFERFLSIVRETCRQKNERLASRARANLAFTAFRDNVCEIPELLTMAAQLGVDRVTITHFVPWQESQRYQSLIYHKKLANQMLKKAQELGDELGLLVDVPGPFHMNSDSSGTREIESNSNKSYTLCYHPWRSVSINEIGDVMPCCATSVVMGDLRKASFDEIWNGRKYRKLRETVNSPKPLSFCKNCALRNIKVGSSESIAFCSDEHILLGGIGHHKGVKSLRSIFGKTKNVLKGTGPGRKLIFYLREFYRRHGAFIH